MDVPCGMCRKVVKDECTCLSFCPAWEDGLHAYVPFFMIGSETMYERRVTPGADVRTKMCACGATVKRVV